MSEHSLYHIDATLLPAAAAGSRMPKDQQDMMDTAPHNNFVVVVLPLAAPESAPAIAESVGVALQLQRPCLLRVLRAE